MAKQALSFDPAGYSLDELKEHAKWLAQVIEEREKADNAALAIEIRELIKARNLVVSNVLLLVAEPATQPSKETERPSGGEKPLAKYRNPANSVETWSGRGRQPPWVKAHLEAGGSKDDLLITDEAE